MGSFSIAMHHEAANKINLQLKGALTREASSALYGVLDRLVKSNQTQMIIDASNLEHLSGEGLHILTIFFTRAMSKGYHVTLRGLNAVFRQLFQLTQLTKQKQNLAIPGDDIPRNITPVPEQPVDITDHKNGICGQWITSPNIAKFTHAPGRAVNMNVHGRTLTSPMNSFGRMWLRTYRVGLGKCGLSPEVVMTVWKDRFTSFWPSGNHLYPSTGAIQPGAVCLINLAMPLGLTLATGAVVIYSNETSFTLMTVQGHMFSGFITFSTYLENGNVYAQTQALIRPNDFIYEASFWLGFGPKSEDGFWIRTMRNISTHFVPGNDLRCPLDVQRKVEVTAELIDRKINWRHFGNIWYNAGIRSFIYMLLSPIRKLVSRKQIHKDN